MKEETRNKLIDVMNKAKELGWVTHDGNVFMMQLEDIEKVLVGILEPEYINNLIKIKRKLDNDVSGRKDDE